MSGKRRATSDLNHDNWNHEEEPEDSGTFQRASERELKKRVIKTARRRRPIENTNSDGTATRSESPPTKINEDSADKVTEDVNNKITEDSGTEMDEHTKNKIQCPNTVVDNQTNDEHSKKGLLKNYKVKLKKIL
ncbi:hypothetical protein JTB14_032393 [Gonioctena quinquepunctata]|nr:hypothetical protein JTB14_032393 [Gonioctena quinquepunctata]